MKERYLARGCASSDIYEVISKRLFLSGSNQGILESAFLETPPGLFFSQGGSLNITRNRQEYAISEAKKAGKMPFVITMHINEANFRYIHKRIWNAKVSEDFLRRFRVKYEPIKDLQGFSGRVAVIALDKMSDDELIAVDTRVGFLLPERGKFKYQSYEEYLRKPEFMRLISQDEYQKWIKGLE